MKELVERHGGAIRVESDPGFGSAFTITLPKGSAHLDPIEADALDVQDEPERASWALYEPAPSELALAATTPPADEEHEASREVDTLLVVDDNADVRAYLRDCLAGAYHVVEAHMADETFNVEAFAGALSMGPRQLQRKLRALTGQTPTEFIRLMRLKRAAQLLEQQAGTVSEIAYEVGFNHPTYFAMCFREVFGTSPSAYAAAKA